MSRDKCELPLLRDVIREGNGNPLQYSCLENPMDGGAWWTAVHGIAKNQTQLSDFTFTFHFHASEKEMATHSSVLAWRIPGTAEPSGLPSMGSHRVGHDWSDLAAAAANWGTVSLSPCPSTRACYYYLYVYVWSDCLVYFSEGYFPPLVLSVCCFQEAQLWL